MRLAVTADMKEKLIKSLQIILFVLIIGVSVSIFIFRDRIENISNFGYIGIFVFCFLTNATVLLPSPSLLLAASCALVLNPWLVAVLAALGSALGELVGYAFGNVTKEISPKFKSFVDKIDEKVKNETLLVFILAALPLPVFDVIGVYSGGIKMNLFKFFLACLSGKFLKMVFYTRIYGILAWLVNLLPGFEWVKTYLDALTQKAFVSLIGR